ncbi:MAG TPA: hypothetical protein VNG69_13185 [Casimicrobiaceae bacterium]|nr:hypothetical protein [Casimicrobiaceae bacterium]
MQTYFRPARLPENRWRHTIFGGNDWKRRDRGWAFIIVLIALAVVAFLARDALMQYFGLARNAAATSESRLPAAARAPVDPTQATPAITAPVERARSVEGAVQQQADDLAKRIEREAR